MGKILDALLGKSFKTSKFKTLIGIAIYQIGFLKNQHHVRWSQARSDVIQLLTLGPQESALLRVDHVIREQNMLDAFVIIEGYCRLLMERVVLIKNSKSCPDELKEAISSLIFVASRYGQLRELQKICGLFTSKFGKQFTTCVAELHDDCGVNPKIVKKLLLRRPSLKTRLKVLKEIASENEIMLRLEGETSEVTQEKLNFKESTVFDDSECKDGSQNLPELKCEEKSSSFMKARKKYKDVATAAQAAIQLAADAAAAAKAAVTLSRFGLHEEVPDHQRSCTCKEEEAFNLDRYSKSIFGVDQKAASKESTTNGISSKSKCGEMEDNKYRSHMEESGHSHMKATMKKISSTSSSSDFDEDIEGEGTMSSYLIGQNQLAEKEISSDGNDDVKGKNKDMTHRLDHCDFDTKFSLLINESSTFRHVNTGKDENDYENGDELNNQSPKQIPLKAQPELVANSVEGRTTSYGTGSSHSAGKLHSQHSNRDRKPMSVRTRWL